MMRVFVMWLQVVVVVARRDVYDMSLTGGGGGGDRRGVVVYCFHAPFMVESDRFLSKQKENNIGELMLCTCF